MPEKYDLTIPPITDLIALREDILARVRLEFRRKRERLDAPTRASSKTWQQMMDSRQFSGW